MYYILIGIVVICIINFIYSKIDSIIDNILLRKYKKLKPMEDKKYISILDSFKESLDIYLKSHLLFNPKALQENCKVRVLKNEIYILVDKNINEEGLKGSIAHELRHIKMNHEEKGKYYMQINIFLLNIFLLTGMLYPILSLKTYLIVFLIGFITYFSYLLIVWQYIKRKQELEADNIAVRLIGEEYLKSLNTDKGIINNFISLLPSFFSDHPSLGARLKNARKTYKAYNKKIK